MSSSTTPSGDGDRCAACSTSLLHAKRCTRCLAVSYCTTNCQKSHWRSHKPDCGTPLLFADLTGFEALSSSGPRNHAHIIRPDAFNEETCKIALTAIDAACTTLYMYDPEALKVFLNLGGASNRSRS